MASGLSQKVQLLIRARRAPAWPPAVASAAAGEGKRHRAVGACVAQDTTYTVYQTAVELNRPRDM